MKCVFTHHFPLQIAIQRQVPKTLCLFMSDSYDSYGSSFSGTFHDVSTTPVILVMSNFLKESFNWHGLNYSSVLLGTIDVSSTQQ